jgi:hypothetical protein
MILRIFRESWKSPKASGAGMEEERPGAADGAKAGPGGGETASKWTVMGIMSIGLFMAMLYASIVNISLPKISLSFQVPLNEIHNKLWPDRLKTGDRQRYSAPK